ncbi:YitT family protein [Metasolibacillus sp.]|uniref:YitT family protein n=1 Tax=Metasolibacillus sp. TaxID=2703680 RepID=UPI0025D452AD|nr:YitT family protein [Metasolibacillus sp.]MCT6926250.1 YitT family protein [Metasolibacillus sp.]MCT6942482.1 YitT family protein [Metasolibacillus sp.]
MYFLTKALALIIGSILLSLGINLFLVPHEILDGGTVGIGLIANYLWGFNTGLIVIILSVPIFIFAWFHYRNYFYNSLHGMMLSAFFIDFLSPVSNLIEIEAIYSSILGGILVGIGIGLMLQFQTSTGGSDFIAQFLCEKTGINVGIYILLIDSIVIILGGLLLSSETFYLSIIKLLFIGITTSLVTSRKGHAVAYE